MRVSGVWLLAVMPAWAQACGSCGCTLNSDWASQGVTVGPGVRLDLRYDDYFLGTLMNGATKVDKAGLTAAARVNQDPGNPELQQSTHNRITTLGLDYAPNYEWAVNVQLPWINRNHQTLGPGDSQFSGSSTKSMGDAKVLVRYQGSEENAHGGWILGLKLPTGASDKTFDAGPATGSLIDSGLEPGSGTTDVILGAYRYGLLTESFGYFTQALWQRAVQPHNDFLPSPSLNVSVGVRYLEWSRVVPQLQLNALAEGREGGKNGDKDNSGSRQIFLSPGANFKLSNHFGAYLYVQYPLYRHVNGLQLEAQQFYTAGLHYRF